MDRMTEAHLAETIRLMRLAQKRYFSTRTADALASMRAAEKLVRDALPDGAAVRSHSPEGLHLFHLAASLLRHQEAWVQARRRIADLDEAGQDATRARDDAARLQGTCEKKERELDRALLAYATPRLHGLS